MTFHLFRKEAKERRKVEASSQAQTDHHHHPQHHPLPGPAASQTTVCLPVHHVPGYYHPPPVAFTPAPASGPAYAVWGGYGDRCLPHPAAPYPDAFVIQPNGAPFAVQQVPYHEQLHHHHYLPSHVDLSSRATHSLESLQHSFTQKTNQYLNQGSALFDRISSKFDAVITSIDGELFSGDEADLIIHENVYPDYHDATVDQRKRDVPPMRPGPTPLHNGSNHFSKVWLYANSRLPPHLPPLKLYMPTYPLLCLAAQFSDRVYTRPTGAEHETHVEADWRKGTKAMVLKSVPLDDMHTIVLAIRGSQNFMDWTVNFRPAPASPAGFLDDAGNLCHSGFLHVARHMIAPVAARLRALLRENPARRHACSLLLTGHSAGGAVAALLYAHMMAEGMSSSSELHALTPCFKRVHCVTFGAPPVSLLPLAAPAPAPGGAAKSLFFSFVNEGDPVPRADKAVISSLLRLYASPAPGSSLETVSQFVRPGRKRKKKKEKKKGEEGEEDPSRFSSSTSSPPPMWDIPPGSLSLAGRVILLRPAPAPSAAAAAVAERHAQPVIEACVVTDEQLRGVVFGDPLCHTMAMYARRIEALAVRAVTAGAGTGLGAAG